jgi:DNA (cytosine-5)-methyltransferase 1
MAGELSVLEICAGAGGQSLGLEQAGFAHEAAIEIEPVFCDTLRLNRPTWRIIAADVRDVSGQAFKGIDLLAGGVPCPPFSIAGKQLGSGDDRDLFPEALRLVEETRPGAVLLENVRGLSGSRFSSYRERVVSRLYRLGYEPHWQVLNASEFGVPQLRPRFVLVALRQKEARHWRWPEAQGTPPVVGEVIGGLMGSAGWPGAIRWATNANGIAPTIVGGSTKHGGPDLGPTRARAEWLRMGIDGLGIADEVPGPKEPVDLVPKLTLRMVARLQGFPDDWQFAGRKTAAYRQIGNAFPPPVAAAVGRSIYSALSGGVRAKEAGAVARQMQLVSA